MPWVLSAGVALLACGAWMFLASSLIAVERALFGARESGIMLRWPGWRLLWDRWCATAADLCNAPRPQSTTRFCDSLPAAIPVALGIAVLAMVPGTVPVLSIDLGEAGALLLLVVYWMSAAMQHSGGNGIALAGGFFAVAGVMLVGGSARFEDVAAAQQQAGLWWAVTQPVAAAAFLALAASPAREKRHTVDGTLGPALLADRLVLVAVAYAAVHLFFGGVASVSDGGLLHAAIGHLKAWLLVAILIWARHRRVSDASAKAERYLSIAAFGNFIVVLGLHESHLEPAAPVSLAVSFGYAAVVAFGGWSLRGRDAVP